MRINRFTHYAAYPFLGMHIPCYYHELTENIEGRNWFYDRLLEIAVWYDFEFSDGFRFWVGPRIKQK